MSENDGNEREWAKTDAVRDGEIIHPQERHKKHVTRSWRTPWTRDEEWIKCHYALSWNESTDAWQFKLHIIGSKVVQNAIFGGFTQFSIHFWPENAQKTTLKFLTFFGPRHPVLLWDRPKWFSKGFFLILHPLLVRTGQKNDFKIFWLKGWKVF